MATQLIAAGNTAADSADVVVASGSSVTVALKGSVDNNARVIISLKDDGGAYSPVGSLDVNNCAKAIVAPGTYRLSRVAGGACGVFIG